MAENIALAKKLEEIIRESGRLAPWSRFDINMNRGCVCVRDLGSWEIPADCEEDEEDYDWQEPTDETKEVFRDICRKAEEAFPGWEVTFTVQEKNWVDFNFKEKELELER